MLLPKEWLLVVLAALSLELAAISAQASGANPQTGFIDKLYEGADGYQARYVVFIPHNYDGKKAFPLILFLHGAGQTGIDGRQQVRIGLGPAINKQEKTFAFITVFPQAHKGGWEANSEDGKRALTIL